MTKQLTLNLDLVEKHRDQAHLRNITYKQRVSNYYDSGVKPRSFKVGDCVLKKRLLYDRVRAKGYSVQTGIDHSKLLASVALAPTNSEVSMEKPLAIHGNADHLKY